MTIKCLLLIPLILLISANAFADFTLTIHNENCDESFIVSAYLEPPEKKVPIPKGQRRDITIEERDQNLTAKEKSESVHSVSVFDKNGYQLTKGYFNIAHGSKGRLKCTKVNNMCRCLPY